MYKRDDKARFLVLYGLSLLVLGLCVMLVASKITNNKILAKSEEIMQNALKNIEENEKEVFENSIYSSEFESGYKFIKLDDNKKQEINNQILENEYINLIIQAKEYIGDNGYLNFNNGEFTDEEMTYVILSSKNISNMQISDLKEESINIFASGINESNINNLINEGKVNFEINTFNKESILKINKVFKNDSYYDVYIDEIYPNSPEKYDEYKLNSKIDYNSEEIVNMYKLHVEHVDNSYKFISVESYNFD